MKQQLFCCRKNILFCQIGSQMGPYLNLFCEKFLDVTTRQLHGGSNESLRRQISYLQMSDYVFRSPRLICEHYTRDKFNALQTSKFSCRQHILHHNFPHLIQFDQFLKICMLVRNPLFLDDSSKSLLVRNNNGDGFRFLWKSIDTNVIDQRSGAIC